MENQNIEGEKKTVFHNAIYAIPAMNTNLNQRIDY